MSRPPHLTKEDLAKYFPPQRPPIKDGGFELGLVLAGTVSAGAYTAGVLDYLIEALDAWQRAKQDRNPDAPPHEVVISTIAGASGGGVNGAMLLRAAGWQFPHGPDDANPFYASWVKGTNLMDLLAPGPDEEAGSLASLLNCAAIDERTSAAITYTGEPLGANGSPRHRSYLADPLRLFMTVGNVNGVPYTIRMAGETHLSHDLFSHADHMRFALSIGNGVANPPGSRPDEVALSSFSSLNWNALGDASLATSAFPAALRPRQLSRPLEVSGYRVVAVPDQFGGAEIVQLIPKWDVLSAGEPDPRLSGFVNVDGGIFNNEPLDLVRTALAGFNGRNDRTPEKANRAVIAVDPFSDPKTLSRSDPDYLTKMVAPIVMSLVYQARFDPADIALAYSEDTYSRFLIAPVGPGPKDERTVGQKAIASGTLGGFSGFIDSSFLDYDFRLGRFNAYAFLSRHLALPETADNPIFQKWTAAQRQTYRFTDAKDRQKKVYLPIVPLMAPLRAKPPTLPKWPRLAALPENLENAIEARLQSVYELAKAQAAPSSWVGRTLMNAYLGLGWWYARGKLRGAAVSAIEKALVEQGLLSKKSSKSVATGDPNSNPIR